jgi:hypothetical protein
MALTIPTENEQLVYALRAEDEGLWFEAQTAAEAYLQQELRQLHEVVEGTSIAEMAIAAMARLHADDEIESEPGEPFRYADGNGWEEDDEPEETLGLP